MKCMYMGAHRRHRSPSSPLFTPKRAVVCKDKSIYVYVCAAVPPCSSDRGSDSGLLRRRPLTMRLVRMYAT